MPARAKCEPVNFDQLASKLETVLKMLDTFKHGVTLSKNQAKKSLREFRKTLRTLSKELKGATEFSFLEEAKLVPTVALEQENADSVLNETERKLELPE